MLFNVRVPSRALVETKRTSLVDVLFLKLMKRGLRMGAEIIATFMNPFSLR